MQRWNPLFFDTNSGDKFIANNPKEDLMNLLIAKSISAGHKLSFNEVKQDPEMVEPNTYAFYFGSFGKAAEVAWYEAGAEMKRRSDDMGKRYTEEEVKAILVDFYKTTGRLPKQTETSPEGDRLPNWGTMVRLLGPKSGWLDAIADEIGITPTNNPVDAVSESTIEVQEDTGACETYDIAEEHDGIELFSNAETQDTTEENDNIGLPSNMETQDTVGAHSTIEILDVIDLQEAQDDIQILQDGHDDSEAETPPSQQADSISIELKINLPGRATPVLLSITV